MYVPTLQDIHRALVRRLLLMYSLNGLAPSRRLVPIMHVAVEKVGFPEKSQNRVIEKSRRLEKIVTWSQHMLSAMLAC